MKSSYQDLYSVFAAISGRNELLRYSREQAIARAEEIAQWAPYHRNWVTDSNGDDIYVTLVRPFIVDGCRHV